jgi:FkbM family methyltransferase
MKNCLPIGFYKFIRFFYRVLFINYQYTFGPIGFFQKTKIDIYGLFGREQFIVNYGKIKFHNKGWEILGEKNGYERLTNLKNVLDLGGFIGDSAILLANQNNERIFVFEPEKEKFKWISKNIKLNNFDKKINAFNYAVVSNNIKKIKFNKFGDFSPGSSIIKHKLLTQTEIVNCINIRNVIKMADFDGLKCDIEGGEFQIIEYFLTNPSKFKFGKGIIEWHFTRDNPKQNKILLDFLNYLKKRNYSFFFYPHNKPFNILDEKKEVQNIVQQKYEGSFYDGITYVNMFYFEKL